MSSEKKIPDNNPNINILEDKDYRYEKVKEHWENCEPTISEMLGGNPQLNDLDIKISRKLLEDLIKSNLINIESVIDCGAGIGRVADNVLKHYFNRIDLVEMNSKFVKYAKEYFINNEKIKDIFCSPLQKFIFKKKYDCIWIQWCLENLEDDDLNIFLKNCHNNLKDKGLIIIKENVEEELDFTYWNLDYSKIRSDNVFQNAFLKNNFNILRFFHHPFWPKDFVKVSIYVLSKKNLI